MPAWIDRPVTEGEDQPLPVREEPHLLKELDGSVR